MYGVGQRGQSRFGKAGLFLAAVAITMVFIPTTVWRYTGFAGQMPRWVELAYFTCLLAGLALSVVGVLRDERKRPALAGLLVVGLWIALGMLGSLVALLLLVIVLLTKDRWAGA